MAGVSILIARRLADMGMVLPVQLPEHTQGYMRALQIRVETSVPLEIIGVYMPSSQPGDKHIRTQLYDVIRQRVEASRAKDEAYNMLVAGDFNAALLKTDRKNGKQRDIDNKHAESIAKADLHTIPEAHSVGSRAFSFRGTGGIEDGSSRIDDVLTTSGTVAAKSVTRVHDLTGYMTDHNAVEASIPYVVLDMVPPPEPAGGCNHDTDAGLKAEAITKLKLPLSQADSQAARLAIEERVGHRFAEVADTLQKVVEEHVIPYWQARQTGHTSGRYPTMQLDVLPGTTVEGGAQGSSPEGRLQDTQQQVEAWASRMVDLILESRQVLMEVAPTCTVRPGGQHCLPRVTARRLATAQQLRRQLAAAQRADSTDPIRDAQLLQKVQGHVTQGLTLRAACRKEHTRLGYSIRSINKEHVSRRQQTRKAKIQALVDSKLKVGGKIVTGQATARNTVALQAVINAKGEVVQQPTEVMRVVEEYYSRKMRPASGVKTGQYPLPQEQNPYPWQREGALDPFELSTAAQSSQAAGATLHTAIADRHAFEACMHTLARGKAPGPDGILNEVLQLLPSAAKDAIHALFQVMWATSCTPSAWKESLTVLLYKNKGSPLQLKYYRQVGLENTLYKLWTRLVTWSMADFAERHNLLSGTQAGFRGRRTTADQIELLATVLEDAQSTGQDIYLMMVDFTEAFDTIDHDKLLTILYHLGYPTDAIEVVKQLYTGASTVVRTPAGNTGAIPIDRGTIQGDSLSPFLFINYLEPLLRWLRVGGRGYTPGMLKQEGQAISERAQIADITYADDLNILTSDASRMQLQASKVTKYSEWAHLVPNATKTVLTGMMHASYKKDPGRLDALRKKLQKVELGGQQPDVHPPDKPFRYLGVMMTMTLSWTPQYQAAYATVKDSLRQLNASCLTTRQKVRVINTVIKPKLQYGFYAAPYTPAQLAAMDSLLTRAIKNAYWLKPYVSTAMAHEDVSKGGLGCASVTATYAQVQVKRLTLALNDDGIHGQLARASMKAAKGCMDKFTADMHPAMLRHCLRLRQLVTVASLGLEIHKGGHPAYLLPKHRSLLADMTGLSEMIAANDEKLHPILVRDVAMLQDLGLKHLSDLYKTRSWTALTAAELKLSHPPATSRHIKALQRVTGVLTQPPGQLSLGAYTDAGNNGCSKPLHATVRTHLRALGLCSSTDLKGTPLAALWEVQRCPLPREESIHDLQQYTRSLLRPPKRTQGANIRCDWQGQDGAITKEAITGYKLFQDLMPRTQQKGRSAKEARDKLMQLYYNYTTDQSIITQVNGRPQANAFNISKGKRTRVSSQQQVTVQWKDTIAQGWVIELAKSIMDYHPASIQEATVEEVADECLLTPDCCGVNAHVCRPHVPGSSEPQNPIMCDTCLRAYHPECLCGAARAAAQQARDDPLQPWCCQECIDSGYTTATLPDALKHYKVSWHDSEEPREHFTAQGDQELLHAWDERCQQGSTTKRQKHETAEGLEAMQMQGDWHPDVRGRYDITIGQECRKKLVVDTQPCNPHVDIEPTGSHEVFVRTVERRHGGQTTSQELACIYTPDGRCQYMLPLERAAQLWQAYHGMRRQCPALFKHLKAGSYAEEVYRLMARYQEGAAELCKGQGPVQYKDELVLPPALMEVFHGLGVTQERYASPLNVHAATQHYWSAHRRDALFGARYDSHRYRHRGASLSHPRACDRDVNASVTTALLDALTQNTPVLSVQVIPAWSDTGGVPAYMGWVQRYPQHCHLLACIPRKKLKVLGSTSMAWEMPACGCGWAVNVMVIGNTAGFTKYADMTQAERRASILSSIQYGINRALHPTERIRSVRQLQPAISGAPHQHTAQLQRLQSAVKKYASTRKDWNDTHDLAWAPASLQEFSREHDNAPDLKYDWQTIAYTDGSMRTVEGSETSSSCELLGAGVYIPSADKKIQMNLTGKCPHSVNIAELAAIRGALEQGAQMIATDSLTSIHQIYKQLHRPQDQQYHMHKKMLQEIVQLVTEAPGTIHLLKVKAHSGIVGNEWADQLATTASEDDAGHITLPYTHPGDHRQDIYWPFSPQEAPECGGDQDAEPDNPKPLSSLDAGLKRLCHKACKYGTANTETIYFSSWKRSEEQRDPSSYHFMNTSKVTHAERATALKYRTGTLCTAKLLYRFKISSSPECMLCGEQDGGHHMAAGCQACTRMYIHRHNTAGRMILKAVMEGRRGGEVVMMDVGREQAEGGADPLVPSRIPREVLPTQMEESIKTTISRHSKPDIFLYQPGRTGVPAKYTIVEIKYCRDTDPEQQLARAATQHRSLAQAIQQADPAADVQYVTIMLGVSGAIFTLDTLEKLRTLGVTGRALETLKYRLHIQAIKELHWIYTVKRKLEKAAAPHTGQGTQMGPSQRRREGAARRCTQSRCDSSKGAKRQLKRQGQAVQGCMTVKRGRMEGVPKPRADRKRRSLTSANRGTYSNKRRRVQILNQSADLRKRPAGVPPRRLKSNKRRS
jgi:ribonuclease HI